MPEAHSEDRSFEIKFFNEKEMDTTLWDIRVEFYKGEERQVSLVPTFEGTAEPVGTLNLPSRKAVSWVMDLSAGGYLLERIRETDRAAFVAATPGGEVFEKEMDPWSS